MNKENTSIDENTNVDSLKVIIGRMQPNAKATIRLEHTSLCHNAV